MSADLSSGQVGFLSDGIRFNSYLELNEILLAINLCSGFWVTTLNSGIEMSEICPVVLNNVEFLFLASSIFYAAA